jgi:hypothetical protein
MLIRDFYVPAKLVSEANQREHWAIRQKRKKLQQRTVALTWIHEGLGHSFFFPMTVTLTRIGPRKLDADNLAGSMKHVQDQIARELGIDDGDSRIRWVYEQRKGLPKEYALEVRLENPDD